MRLLADKVPALIDTGLKTIDVMTITADYDEFTSHLILDYRDPPTEEETIINELRMMATRGVCPEYTKSLMRAVDLLERKTKPQ